MQDSYTSKLVILVGLFNQNPHSLRHGAVFFYNSHDAGRASNDAPLSVSHEECLPQALTKLV